MKNHSTLYLRTVLLAAAALCFASCTDYQFAKQDVVLKYDGESDSLTLQIDTGGLYLPARRWQESPEASAAMAVKRVRQVANGARYFHVLAFPFVIDLDKELAQSERSPAPAELFGALLDENVKVLDASMDFDENDEAGLSQTVRVENVQPCLAAFNDLVRIAGMAELNQTVREDAFGRDAFETEASVTNALEFFRSGEPVVTLTVDALELRIPVVPSDIAWLLKAGAELHEGDTEAAPRASSRRNAAVLVALTRGLDSLSIEDDVALLRYPVGEDGTLRLQLDGPRNDKAAALTAALR